MRQLPPLNAVRAFEACARHLSFHRAAEELHVTPSAVSHQIRQLEDYLGARLFRRLTRRVVMTDEGQAYLPAIRGALDQIDAATRRIVEKRTGTVLNLNVAPSFAAEWLVLRLSDFQARYPGIEVRLSTTVDLTDLDRGDADVVIRYGAGAWQGVVSHRILTEELVPVCSPRLLEGPHALRTPHDLRHATLIHVVPRIGQWGSWLRAAGLDDIDPERGPKFQSTPLAMEAVMAGMGVMITNRILAAQHLKEGRLIVPFDMDIPSDMAYFLLYRKERADEAKVAAFRDWLLAALESD